MRLTSPDRVLWPGLGLTKRWLLAYYEAVAPLLLPHVVGHPLTLHRFPEGIEGKHFFQTRAPAHPEFVRTVTFHPERSGKVFEVVVLDDLEGLRWAAQVSTIELHPFLGRADALDRPRWLVLDLDPGPGTGLLDAAALALRARDLLVDLGHDPWVRSSGKKGLHVVVDLDGSRTYDDTKPLAHAIAGLLRKDDPQRVTDNMAMRHREGRVFVDWSQNDPGKSTVATYSLRALRVPTVAAPLDWAAVADAVTTGNIRTLLVTPADLLGG